MVEAVWRPVGMQVNSLRRKVQSIEANVSSLLNETVETYVSSAVGLVGGFLTCLLITLGVFLCGFFQITLKERIHRETSNGNFSTNIKFCYFSIFDTSGF